MPYTRKIRYLASLVLVDAATVSAAWLAYYYIRVESGLFSRLSVPELALPMLVTGLYWLLLFRISGLYKEWFFQSRIDELIVIAKTVTLGVLILFFLVFVDDTINQDPSASRLKIVLYWCILFGFVGGGRLALRSVRRRMLASGIGQRTTVAVGTRERVLDLAAMLRRYPALGYRVVGYLSPDAEEEADGVPRLGALADLETTIPAVSAEEVIITLDSSDHERLLDVLGRCAAFRVGIKIRPDLYDIVSGQARTSQLYGIPLIEVTPRLMSPWGAFFKRALDLAAATSVCVAGLPLFVLIALLQKLTSRGPVFYTQERVGKDGAVFRMRKFRTMFVDAEARSGPAWARKDDPRVTPLGRVLRRWYLDELPQVFNVLRGEMSLIGPRPERPYFVERFVREIPLYRRRLNVRPGITGWAQVKLTYDQSVEDVRTKLSYDLFYIENMSLGMDLKIVLHTMHRLLAGKGHA